MKKALIRNKTDEKLFKDFMLALAISLHDFTMIPEVRDSKLNRLTPFKIAYREAEDVFLDNLANYQYDEIELQDAGLSGLQLRTKVKFWNRLVSQFEWRERRVREEPVQVVGFGSILKKLLDFIIIILGSGGFLGHGLKEMADLIKFIFDNAVPDEI